ncbi:class I SAM-dependent methyltransferase [Pseudochelatococcus sp. B33]
MVNDDEILTLLARWDRQQEGYIKQREERFEVMFQVLESVFGEAFTVIDAACGPGSLSRRLLDRFPAARVVAIDADVMLLEMARVSLASDSDRARVVETDLSGAAWDEQVLDAVKSMNADKPSALVSTTALHWLSPGDLAEFYGAAGELLKPGGIVMNGDHMRFDIRWPTLAGIAKTIRQQVEHEAVTHGEDDWAGWWERAAKIPRLAALKEQRDAFFASRPLKRARSGEDCSVDFHVAALRHAGFVETGTIWQQFDNYVVFGRLPE